MADDDATTTIAGRVAGVMSGTSLDGIDVVIADLAFRRAAPGGGEGLAEVVDPTSSVVAFDTVPFSAADRAAVAAVVETPDTVSLSTLSSLNMRLGDVFAAAVETVAKAHGVPLSSLDIVSSHGQTVWHDPGQSTLQIGEPAVIAARTGVLTVGDFRQADVAAGGHGAPVTSSLDCLLLRPPPPAFRAVQNIGGMGNVTFVHATEPAIAFDTGPGNVLIDFAVRDMTRRATAAAGHVFDVDGKIAASGTPSMPLLTSMLSHPYFAKAPPKTTGREMWTKSQFEAWKADAAALGVVDGDLVATLTELTAVSIAQAYKAFCPGELSDVMVAGGGARNGHLMARLAVNLELAFGRPVPVRNHDEEFVCDSDAKEALCFAWLGLLAVHGIPNNVPSATGARDVAVMGKVCKPPRK